MTNKDVIELEHAEKYIVFLKRELLYHERSIWVLSVTLALVSCAWMVDIITRLLK